MSSLRKSRSNPCSAARPARGILYIVGLLWVCLGLAANEWTIPIVLGIDALGPRSVVLTRIFNLGVISWGLCTLRWRSKDVLLNANLFFCVTVLTLAFAEGTLRLFPTTLGYEFANGMLTKYHTRTGGIYYYDPVIRMLFMEPNRSDKMYYFGYIWRHQTDNFGFRNFRTVSNAAVVLLGDSFIYGHGVDIRQTVGYFIDQISGHSVFNLAQQGDSSLEQAYKLTEYLQQFRSPQYVLYFFYENDITDLSNRRPKQELLEFIDAPLADIEFKPRTDIKTAVKMRDEQNRLESRVGSLYSLMKQRIYLLKLFDWINLSQSRKRSSPVRTERSEDVNDEEFIGWSYTKKAIIYMNYISEMHGARFFIVPITPDNKKHYAILRKFARAQGIDFIDTQFIDRANQSLFLPRDGHFNEAGARTMAQIIVEHLRRQPELARASGPGRRSF